MAGNARLKAPTSSSLPGRIMDDDSQLHLIRADEFYAKDPPSAPRKSDRSNLAEMSKSVTNTTWDWRVQYVIVIGQVTSFTDSSHDVKCEIFTLGAVE